jgi:hypothetical protein
MNKSGQNAKCPTCNKLIVIPIFSVPPQLPLASIAPQVSQCKGAPSVKTIEILLIFMLVTPVVVILRDIPILYAPVSLIAWIIAQAAAKKIHKLIYKNRNQG